MSFHPRIVVLDGYTLNPGDLSWREFEALGEFTVHARTRFEDILSRCHQSDIVLTNKVPLSADTLSELPCLRYIGVLATGYNVIDVAAARARGIPVSNVPGYGTMSVAQHTFALLLELARQVGRHGDSVRSGQWSTSPDWCYWHSPQIELSGLTLGIVGAGRIGEAVAALGRAFGMKVQLVTRSGGQEKLRQVLQDADVVSLHCPLTPDTKHLLNANTLAWMKPTAFLLNTSRGPLIDEDALAQALNDGRIAGAGLDVLSAEPPPPDHPLLSACNCIITPHVAWATSAARARLLQIAVENIRGYLNGTPRHVVN